MSKPDDVDFVRQLLDAYAIEACRVGVASTEPDGRGVPPEMQGEWRSAGGWVEWVMLPSTLNDDDVSEVEQEFGVSFPPLFQAYLIARFHMFDQVHSRRYNQLIFMTDTPSRKPLEGLRRLMWDWEELIDSGFIPFATWVDNMGPMCFDNTRLGPDGDCPIIHMDTELLVRLGDEGLRRREDVLPLVQPVHESFREFLVDVFGPGESIAGPDQ